MLVKGVQVDARSKIAQDAVTDYLWQVQDLVVVYGDCIVDAMQSLQEEYQPSKEERAWLYREARKWLD